MTILREIDAAVDLHGDVGIQRRHLRGGQRFRRDAKLAGFGGGGGFLLQRMRRLAKHEHAAFHQSDVAKVRFQSQIQFAAQQAEIAQGDAGGGHVLCIGGAHEVPAPFHEVQIEPGLDVKGALRIEHPFQSQRDHAGCREGNEMAGADHARAAERTAIVSRNPALQDRDAMPALEQVVGGTQANDAAAEDGDVLRR